MRAEVLPTVRLPGSRFRRVMDVIAVFLLLAAAGSPWFLFTPTAEKATSPPLWLIVDVSRSMMAGTPSRLDLARSGIASWLYRQGVRLPRPVGLIIFAAHARVVVAPTTDSRIIGSQISRIHTLAELPDLAPQQGDPSGTNLASGLVLAQEWSNDPAMTTWLLSDGDDPAPRLPDDSIPRAHRAWVVGSPDEGHPVPNTDPAVMSRSRPEWVKHFTAMSKPIVTGAQPPELPLLAAAPTASTSHALTSWLALLAVVILLISAIPQRLFAGVVLALSGCASPTDEDAASRGRQLILQARMLSPLERAPVLRHAEAELRTSMRSPSRMSTDRLHDLVVCLLDQALSEPPDLQAAGLAAELAIRLPAEQGGPLRARARWLASLISPQHHEANGSDGVPSSDDTGNETGDSSTPPGKPRSRDPKTPGTDIQGELPGAGRLPVVADSTVPQFLTHEEAMRVLAAAARRLTQPAPPKRPPSPKGIPDW